MRVNEEKGGVIQGVGPSKLRVVIDGAERADVDSREARVLAEQTAVAAGFSGGGLCSQPVIGPIGPDDEIVDGADALNPDINMQGFRAEFLFAQRP